MRKLIRVEPVKEEKKKLKVAAYCRVSTKFESQQSSIALQISNYETVIQSNLQWEYAGVYFDYENKANDDKQIYFINELSNHNELIKYDKVKEMVLNMQYRYFTKLEQIPQKLNISLRNLLLTNINITLEFLSVEPRYAYYNSIGEYALIKLPETKEGNIIPKELIRKAYIARNISIDDYIDFLDKECRLCGCDLNYVQKEKMKEYLLNVI